MKRKLKRFNKQRDERPIPPAGNVNHSVREVVDRVFLNRIRELEDVYYGESIILDEEGAAFERQSDGWKHGFKNKRFEGKTLKQWSQDLGVEEVGKTVFDVIHALIWEDHRLAMIEENEAQGEPYDDICETKPIFDDDGNEIGIENVKDTLADSVARIAPGKAKKLKRTRATNEDLNEDTFRGKKKPVRATKNARR